MTGLTVGKHYIVSIASYAYDGIWAHSLTSGFNTSWFDTKMTLWGQYGLAATLIYGEATSSTITCEYAHGYNTIQAIQID